MDFFKINSFKIGIISLVFLSCNFSMAVKESEAYQQQT